MSTETIENSHAEGRLARAARWLTLAGFLIYALAAAHSIAASWIGLSAAILAWLVRAAATRRTGVRRTPLDLPLWLFFAWTALSCFLSAEPRVSIPKLVNVSTLLMFYLTQSMLTRRNAILLACVLIVSASAGVLWGAGELVVGRGVVVRALDADSPLRAQTPLGEGDAVWRVNGRRVTSVAEIDDAIRQTRAGARASLSVISHGEHVEWPGVVVTEEMRRSPSPSGIDGGGRTHNFRASGWTRHYETFAESLQIIAQLALGLALAAWLRRKRDEERDDARTSAGNDGRVKVRRGLMSAALPAVAFLILAAGIALTAMRTTLVAFAVGACVVAWRAARGRQRAAVVAVVAVILALGALAVWRTRASGALELKDSSSDMRLEVARIAARRVLVHPLFGHGMDAVHEHWNEWGFPGTDMLHAHSTPIQLAFDRGIPALIFWLWLMYVFWRLASRAETMWRDAPDAPTHGLALGIAGALAGFLASSLVNYNFGDSEIALLVWWMMGVVVILNEEKSV
ncbi:MAG TPA: O-antigen ligase family protein [Pyrinomonadaceae bacterium]|nr:O-antigen ligase family protein [Pyrinomonadaceae bacterium]